MRDSRERWHSAEKTFSRNWFRQKYVPTVERGFFEVVFWSIEIAGDAGQGVSIINNTTNTIIIAIIVRFLIKQLHNMNMPTKIAISMILAGGLSNLIDRIARGKVIDYIDVSSFINLYFFLQVYVFLPPFPKLQ